MLQLLWILVELRRGTFEEPLRFYDETVDKQASFGKTMMIFTDSRRLVLNLQTVNLLHDADVEKPTANAPCGVIRTDILWAEMSVPMPWRMAASVFRGFLADTRPRLGLCLYPWPTVFHLR